MTSRNSIQAPISIELVQPDRLRIVWDESQKIVRDYDAWTLRSLCPCAACVNEVSGERMLNPDNLPTDMKVSNAALTGNYGLSIDFSDGHNTGIYSWEYLASIAGIVDILSENK